MKQYIALLLILVLSSVNASVFAGEGQETYEKKPSLKMEDRAVIAHDFDFSVTEEGGVVTANWNKFDGEGFDWFKLVYSTSNPEPVYPTDKTVFVGNKDQLSNSFRLQEGASKHYLRICAVVLNEDYSKDRYCSEVKTIEATVTNYEKKEYVKDEYKDKAPIASDYDKTEMAKKEAVKKAYEKKQEGAKKKTTENTNYLSKNVQARVDTVLANFVQRLENKGFSDDKMVETIDIVLERLAKRKTDARYGALISYMETVLKEYRAEYDSGLGDLESIFEGF